VGLFGRKRRGRGQGTGDGAYLLQFAKTRQGVEAFIEAPAEGGKPTVVLVDADGVWTRRRVPNAQMVRKFGTQLGLPVHDVDTTGYPDRMQATSVDDVARPS